MKGDADAVQTNSEVAAFDEETSDRTSADAANAEVGNKVTQNGGDDPTTYGKATQSKQ